MQNTTSICYNPSTSENLKDYENKNLQAQTIHETYLSAMEQSLSISFFYPFFSNTHSNSMNSFYLWIIPWILKPYWNITNRSCSGNWLWMDENSRPVTKAPIMSTSPLLLECLILFPILYIDKQTRKKLLKTNLQTLWPVSTIYWRQSFIRKNSPMLAIDVVLLFVW